MTNKVVLDANVFLKLILEDESDSAEADGLISTLMEKRYLILAPALFLYEVLNVVTDRKRQVPPYSALDLISDYRKSNLRLMEIDDDTIKKAIDIANTGNEKSGYPSFYDSVYHALAIINGCPFITADKRHKAKTEDLGNITLLGDWKGVVL